MVYRGIPSKACERCRQRRLKCDLRRPSCSQCIRIQVDCVGYRDVTELRILDQSADVGSEKQHLETCLEPQYLPIALELQAREAYFAHYVSSSTSRCWTFIKHYHHPFQCPSYLSTAIDAVSLAYFAREVFSDAVQLAGRRTYSSALRQLREVLRLQKDSTCSTVVLASLLLDIYEKLSAIFANDYNKTHTHMDGAIALAVDRGVSTFQTPHDVHLLSTLVKNSIACYLVRGQRFSHNLLAIWAYSYQTVSATHGGVDMCFLTNQYLSLHNKLEDKNTNIDCYVAQCLTLDKAYRFAEESLPEYWQYSTIPLSYKSPRCLNDFYHLYTHHNICQARNTMRVIRLLLNQSILRLSRTMDMTQQATETTAFLTDEICASIPPYADCDGPAQPRIPASEHKHRHTHAPSHRADCHQLVFPLYAAAKLDTRPQIQSWIMEQLRYLGDHFYLREATIAADILANGRDVSPWQIYVMAGSYAFNG